MKTSNKILMGGLAFIIISLLSLMIAARVNIVPVEIIEGNGQMKTKTRDLSAFNGIEVNTASFDVYLSQGQQRVDVTADNNIHEFLETTVVDGVLKIVEKDGVKFKSKNRLAVTIALEQLSSLSIDAPGNIHGEDTLDLNDVQLEVNGVGDITLALNAEHVEAIVNGPGKIVLSGMAKSIHVDVTGVGDVIAGNLPVEIAKAKVNGPGDVRLNVSKTLDATVDGIGDILYKGDPVVTYHLNGSGQVKKIAE